MNPLRDDVERVIDAWNAYEASRGQEPIIDYDCRADRATPAPASGRFQVLHQVVELHARALACGDDVVAARLTADEAFLRALLGEHRPLDEYLHQTQGTSSLGWSLDYLQECGETIRGLLSEQGIAWSPGTTDDLRDVEGPIEADDIPDAIRQAADELEPAVRAYTGRPARFNLSITVEHADAYWGYWLDGTAQAVRLRLNARRLSMTKVQACQFALHEVLGHGLQYASLAQTAASTEVPWVRQFSVHDNYQPLFEGLAQAWPLFLTPDDPALITRVRLDHFRQLVSARAHQAVNSGTPVDQCLEELRRLLPFWTDNDVADLLADRSNNPRLRSYLWSYPAGLDWFVRLSHADAGIAQKVIRQAYVQPLSPEQLQQLWPDGPHLGGETSPPLRLRQPNVP